MIARIANAVVLVVMLIGITVIIAQIGLTAIEAMSDPYPDACAALSAVDCIALSQEGGW